MVKNPKAASADDCTTLEQLPNIGPSLADEGETIEVFEGAQV